MKRKDGESFSNYKARRKEDQTATKAELKPRQLWNSAEQGTYVRAVHGNI